MDFGVALRLMKDKGYKMTRKGWNGKGQYVQIQYPTETSKMTLPYFYIQTVDGNLVPWLASQTDLLVEDWEIV